MIETPALPPHALLQRYSDRGYTDCFACQLPRSLRFEQYVEAFYSTAVFRLERWILRWAAQRPSTDAELRELAAGGREQPVCSVPFHSSKSHFQPACRP